MIVYKYNIKIKYNLMESESMKKRRILLIVLIAVIAFSLLAFPASIFASYSGILVYDYSITHYYYSIISSPFNEPITIPVVYKSYADALSAAKNMATAAMYREEIQNKIATLNDQEFINYLYDALFHRTPDNTGSANWLNGLNEGLTRSIVIDRFINSAEFEMRYIYSGSYGEDVYKIVYQDPT
jgi:hypothetical protein